MRRARGFTLIELIVVVIMVGAGLAAITSLYANSVTTIGAAEQLQIATEYTQQCAERVIQVKRDFGITSSAQSLDTYASPTSSPICTVLGTLPSGYARTVYITATYTGTSTSVCPNGATCRDVAVTTTTGSLSYSANLLLVSY